MPVAAAIVKKINQTDVCERTFDSAGMRRD
jgi:hypothetical protein